MLGSQVHCACKHQWVIVSRNVQCWKFPHPNVNCFLLQGAEEGGAYSTNNNYKGGLGTPNPFVPPDTWWVVPQSTTSLEWGDLPCSVAFHLRCNSVVLMCLSRVGVCGTNVVHVCTTAPMTCLTTRWKICAYPSCHGASRTNGVCGQLCSILYCGWSFLLTRSDQSI